MRARTTLAATIVLVAAALFGPSAPAQTETGASQGDAFDSAPISTLLRALTADEPPTRARAAQELGERGDPSVVTALVRVLRTDSSVVVRGWALRALDQLATPEARAAVARAAASDTDPRVRELAARLTGLPAGGGHDGEAEEREEPSRPAGSSARAASEPPMPQTRDMELGARDRSREPGHGAITQGWGVLIGSYGLALMIGTMQMTFDDGDNAGRAWKLYIPVFGPMITALTDLRGRGFITLSILSWVWTGIQLTGLVVLAVGYGQRNRARRDRERARDETRNAGLAVSPGGPTSPLGLTVSGWFR